MEFCFQLEKTMGQFIPVDGVDTTSSKILIGMKNAKGEILRGIRWTRKECEKGSWGYDDEFKKKNILREGTIIEGNWTYSGKMKYDALLANAHLEEGSGEYKDEEVHLAHSG